MLASKAIETDIIRLLTGSRLATEVSGGIYRAGLRPRGSEKEDIIVDFISGTVGYPSSGIVNVLVYVKDITPYGNGVNVEDGRRVDELQYMAGEWVESLTAGVSAYRFELDSTITSEDDEAIGQHFIVVRLKYYIFDNN